VSGSRVPYRASSVNLANISNLGAINKKSSKRGSIANTFPKCDDPVSSDKTTSFLHGWFCQTRTAHFLSLTNALYGLFSHALIV
jgi:hypothetical protein